MTANSFGSRAALQVAGEQYEIYRLDATDGSDSLPFSLKILLENLLRNEDGANITAEHVNALAQWDPSKKPDTEIQFTPARVILQDLTGVPAVVDLAAMREAMQALGGDPKKINPLIPAELVIDHSVVADVFGRPDAFTRNVEIEFERNHERFQFLRWGQDAFSQFKVVPPGTGIVHQVNIEYLARVVMSRDGLAYPDTCVGTDSHTTMQNGLGVLGWGVGGIEAEAAMLGQPISMLIPNVVGFRLSGELPSGATATDLVLTITEQLRKHGVVGKFVEFYGEGVAAVPVANRATIGNMSPEFGSTCAIFPIDAEHAGLPQAHRPPARGCSTSSRRTPRSRGSGTTPPAQSAVLRGAEPRPVHRGPVDRGPEAPAGPDRARRRQDGFPRRPAELRGRGQPGQRPRRHLPGLGPGGGRRRDQGVEPGPGHPGRRHADERRPRLGGDRRDHFLHEHLQPLGHGRRRAAGQERGRAGPEPQALGEDLAGARAPRWSWTTTSGPGCCPTWTSSGSTWSATAAPPASATPGRCRPRSARR